MKKSRKAALAAIFTAAMNMNGCAYGPPPDESIMDYSKAETTSAVVEEATDEMTQTTGEVIEQNL